MMWLVRMDTWFRPVNVVLKVVKVNPLAFGKSPMGSRCSTVEAKERKPKVAKLEIPAVEKVIPTPKPEVEKIIAQKLQKVKPAAAPIEVKPAVVIPVVTVKPMMIDEPIVFANLVYTNPEGEQTDLPCPVCKCGLIAYGTSSGVKLWCNQPANVCNTTENPFGHGRNKAAAFEVINDKWRFALGTPREA